MLRALCAVIVVALWLPAALAQQPGSIGGAFGKHDKSVSGGEQPAVGKAPRRHSTDKGENAAVKKSCSRIAGTWHWVFATTTAVNADGTAKNSSGLTASWTCKARDYVFVWSHGVTDRMTLSDDGNSLAVTSSSGASFTSTRY